MLSLVLINAILVGLRVNAPDAFRACTHKSRLFGNRWLMSALPPKADIRLRS